MLSQTFPHMVWVRDFSFHDIIVYNHIDEELNELLDSGSAELRISTRLEEPIPPCTRALHLQMLAPRKLRCKILR
jgi:hypothetical protein